TGAWAQNCTLPNAPNVANLPAIGSSPASVAGMLGTTIATANTAFALQSTAFVGSPPDPKPDQQGGGVWIRGVGGTVELQTRSSTTVTDPLVAGATATVPCRQTVRESFGGVQF